jgi:Flp pilus assembly protein TadD
MQTSVGAFWHVWNGDGRSVVGRHMDQLANLLGLLILWVGKNETWFRTKSSLMDNLQIKYSTSGKALPPRPIRLQLPGWAGSPDLKMDDGSEPQPWHCPPFVDGATDGLELVNHYDTECHVYHENGDLKIDWDYAREPGGVLGADEFGVFAPLPAKFYFFASLVDLQAPPGYVLCIQPHPRFYTDDTGTVPAAVVGHVQTEWWPKKLFVVFKAPKPGERHVFRKGEPYVQLTCVPQRRAYQAVPMPADENAFRRDQELRIVRAKSFIARDVWQNPGGSEFNDHYRTLARVFARDGKAAVQRTVDEAFARRQSVVPPGKTIGQYMELAYQYQRERKFIEAREVLFHVRLADPGNAEAASRLGVIAGSTGLPELAVKMMRQAVALRPRNPVYYNNLGVALRRMGRLADAEASFRAALQLNANDPGLMSNLGFTIALQGRGEEGLAACRSALALGTRSAVAHYRTGQVLSQLGRESEARTEYEAALAADPAFAPARQALARPPGEKAQIG